MKTWMNLLNVMLNQRMQAWKRAGCRTLFIQYSNQLAIVTNVIVR